ncbi:CAT RNA binding domain-containing protein [Enterococcus faecium]
MIKSLFDIGSEFFFWKGETMKVKKIINNNVALIDRGGNEAIIYMTGIAFKKKLANALMIPKLKKHMF